jgi:molecular chaperone DnaK
MIHGASRMKRTFAIDFGSDTTVIAGKTGITDDALTRELSAFASEVSRIEQDGQSHSCVSVPTLVHYSTGGDVLIGEEVIRAGLPGHPSTLQGMKHYILVGSPASTTVNGSICRYCDAGTRFLSMITGALAGKAGTDQPELVFTVPSGSSGLFEEHVSAMLLSRGIRNYRFCDEILAALYASGFPLACGSLFLFYDHGGDALRVSVVIVDDDSRVPGGISCRVLGFASAGTAGKEVDSLLTDAILKESGLSAHGARARGMFSDIKYSCAGMKEALSTGSTAEYALNIAGVPVSGSISQEDLEDLLRSGGFFAGMESTVRRALDHAFSRGFAESAIKGVVMAGGCSSIPCVRAWMVSRFGEERVFCSSPAFIIARGALLVSSDTTFSDSIKHDYALRSWNSARGKYDYHTLVRRGTRIPGNGPVARLQIRATYDGQTELGLLVYEVRSGPEGTDGTRREIVHEMSGSVKLLDQPHDPGDHVEYRPVNEKDPVFISANPPAVAGETRFDVSFTIDGGGYLRMTARDRKTGRIVNADSPVVRLK